MINISLSNEAKNLSEYMDSITIERIESAQINKFESYEDMNLISFDWFNIKAAETVHSRITIVHTKEHLFFFCEDLTCLEMAGSLVKTDVVPERCLYLFFNDLIKDDIDFIEALEEQITDTEDELLTSHSDYAREIIKFRRLLLKLKRYYEQLNQIFEDFTENENKIIAQEYSRYFRILDNKIDRLYSHVLNLRDYVTQVREAYQAQIDIQQNNLMKVFTVVTAVFLPLTLIAGWYGMNLQMPEYGWEYGYQSVILLSILIVAGCVLYFKHKKWL